MFLQKKISLLFFPTLSSLILYHVNKSQHLLSEINKKLKSNSGDLRNDYCEISFKKLLLK